VREPLARSLLNLLPLLFATCLNQIYWLLANDSFVRSIRLMRSTQRLWSQAAAVAAPVSSEMEVMLGGGKEYTAVEATRPHCSHYSRQSRRSHCSRRRGGPRRSNNNVRPCLPRLPRVVGIVGPRHLRSGL
jgi:hypothetical protein